MLWTRETDPMLRRFERNQVVASLAMAALAALVGRFDAALGVVGGGLLMAFSYRAIKGGVDAIVAVGAGNARPAEAGSRIGSQRLRRLAKRRVVLVAGFIGRYALLAFAAYVMLACLRVHPVGLLVGAASPVVAVAVEALCFVHVSSRPGQSH